MKMLIGAVAVLGLTTIALAADEAEAPVEEEAVVDCTTLEDADAKAKCEADKAAAEQPADEKGGKGKGLKKSENNKMEKFDEE
jgi:hypothetical protein